MRINISSLTGLYIYMCVCAMHIFVCAPFARCHSLLCTLIVIGTVRHVHDCTSDSHLYMFGSSSDGQRVHLASGWFPILALSRPFHYSVKSPVLPPASGYINETGFYDARLLYSLLCDRVEICFIFRIHTCLD